MRFNFLLALFVFCGPVLFSTSTVSIAANKKQPKKIAQLEFRDISVGDALKILSEQSEMNVIASKQAAQIKMTMYLHDIAPRDVLEAMAKTYNLWYQRDPRSGIVRVYTVQEFRLGQVDYKNEKTKIFTFKHERNALDFAYIIQDLYGFERVRLNQGANEWDIINNLSDRLERFDIIARNTMDLGGSESSSNFGINSSNGGGNNNNNGNNRNNRNGNSNNLNNGNNGNNRNNRNNRSGNQNRNRNRDNNTPGLYGALEENEIVDSRKILPETESNAVFSGRHVQGAHALGQFIERHSPIYVTMIRQQNRVLVRTRDQDVLKEVQELYKEIDIEISTLLLEVKVLEVNLSDDFTSIFDFSINNDNFNVTKGGVDFATLASQRPDSNRTTSISDTIERTVNIPGESSEERSFSSDSSTEISQTLGQITGSFVRGALGDPAVVAGLINDNFQARLQLMEREGRATTLAAPMLTTTNQEVSRIFLGEERPITTDIDVVCPDGNGNQDNISLVCKEDPQTEIRPIGRTLLLTPNINANGTVNIRILIEESDVCIGCGTIPTETGERRVDTVVPRTFAGTVIAANGQTIAMGGLIQEISNDAEKKVPFFGDIPVIGGLFTDDIQARSRKELVIIIRPFIMNNTQQANTTHQQWLNRNSVHPSAATSENMGVYSNEARQYKSYKLEKPYKEYSKQDNLDQHQWDKGEFNRPPQTTAQPVKHKQATNKQQTYIKLTQYAAKSVRLEAHQREKRDDVSEVNLNNTLKADLLYDVRIRAVPVASWRQGGIHVTAVQVFNLSSAQVRVDFRNMKGRWLSSSIERETLSKRGDKGDNTYLYVVSSGAFEEVL